MLSINMLLLKVLTNREVKRTNKPWINKDKKIKSKKILNACVCYFFIFSHQIIALQKL